MRITESCAECLYDKQRRLTDDREYLETVRRLLDGRDEDITAPYMIYLFNREYEKRFGKNASYEEMRNGYNALVMSMADSVRKSIEASDDPLATALMYARAGNYIDFGALNNVDEETFLSLLESAELSGRDRSVIASFREQCEKAESFLLIADNCGEIVLDRLLLEQLRKEFPRLQMTVMVRGGEVLNDATGEDARFAGLDRYARIVSNGMPLAGTVYELLPEDAKKALDGADVILAKGQGNYESLTRQGRHIFYAFLCKCALFTGRFKVPQFTGIFVEEQGGD